MIKKFIKEVEGEEKEEEDYVDEEFNPPTDLNTMTFFLFRNRPFITPSVFNILSPIKPTFCAAGEATAF